MVCCDNFIKIITSEGHIVCGNCGLIINNSIFNYSPPRVYNDPRHKDRINFNLPSKLENGSKFLGTIIDPKDDKTGKFNRIVKIQKIISINSIKEEWKESIYYIIVKQICQSLDLSLNTLIYSKNILKKLFSENPKYFFKRNKFLISSAIVFQASRIYDPQIKDIDFINLNTVDYKNIHSIPSKYFGGKKKEVISDIRTYLKLMMGEKVYGSILSNKSFRAFHKYVYEISKLSFFNTKNFMLYYLSKNKIMLKNKYVINRNKYNYLANLAISIYNKVDYYKSPPTSKSICCIYIAIVLTFDEFPIKLDGATNGVINRICNELNISLLSKIDKKTIQLKYKLYPSNFKKSYFINKINPIKELIDIYDNVIDCPKGFHTEFGNHYVYIPKSNPYVYIKIYREKLRIQIDNFVSILRKIITSNKLESQEEKFIYNFLAEGDLISVNENGQFKLKYSIIRSNSIINKLLNSKDIIYFNRKKKKTSKIKIRGSIEMGDTLITIKTNRFKDAIVTIKKPNRNNIIRSESYDLVSLENMLKEIENRNFKLEDIASIKPRFIKPTIKLLINLNVITKKNDVLYQCNMNFNDMMATLNQGFLDKIFQTVSTK